MTEFQKIAELGIDPARMRYWPFLFGKVARTPEGLSEPKDLRPESDKPKSALKGTPLQSANFTPTVVTNVGSKGRC